MPSPPIRDEFQQAAREALDHHIDQQTPEPTRPDLPDRGYSPGVGPGGPGAVAHDAWANDYNKAVQDRQADIHAGRQDAQTPEAPERAEAKQALAEHEAEKAGHSREKGLDAGPEIDGSRSARNDLKAEQAAARGALDQHEKAGPGQGPDKPDDIGRKPDDIDR